jgi:acetyl esterase/lipase
MHYLCSGEVLGHVDGRGPSQVVVGADHVQVHPPHDYGVAVVLISVVDRVVPVDQQEPLTRGVEGFLLASSLDGVDTPRAQAEFTRVRAYAETLPEPSRALMRLVNDRAVAELGARLLAVVDAMADDPAMPFLSPQRAPAPPLAPVFLLHGSDDNVIPSVETVLLGEYLDGKTEVHGLLSGLITHAEVNRAPTATEAWRLASFWRRVLEN